MFFMPLIFLSCMVTTMKDEIKTMTSKPAEKSVLPQIGVIPLDGVITLRSSDAGLFADNSGIIAAEDVCSTLDSVLEDEQIHAVILQLNSPGGEVVATDMIYNKILELRKNGKPVIACMEVSAASGGYYIAAACDYIVAHKFTTTGSIGVIMGGIKYYDLFKKIGLAEENFTSGVNKAMLSGGSPTTPEAAAIANDIVQTVYLGFAQAVSTGRNIPLEKIVNGPIGDGRIFLGEEALKVGLVDELGGMKNAEKQAARAAKLPDGEYEVVWYHNDPEWRQILDEILKISAQQPAVSVELPGASPAEKLLQNSNAKLFYLMR